MTHAALPAGKMLAAAQAAYDDVVQELRTPTRADGIKHHQQDRRTAIIRLSEAVLRTFGPEHAVVNVAADDFCLIYQYYLDALPANDTARQPLAAE